jgi:hypothetical protein
VVQLLGSTSIFLFDGLDEVPEQPMRQRLFDSVTDLLEQYKQPRVILSARPYALSQGHSSLGLEFFEPLPLNRRARQTFAVQWYRAINVNLGQAMSEKDAAARAEDLARTAEKVTDLAENPLLLSILALIHFNKNGLPVERAKLYDHATLAMLGHWDRSPSGRDLGEDTIPKNWGNKLGLSEPAIRLVLEHLAHRIQFSEVGSEFPKQIALDALCKGISEVASHTLVEERAGLLLRLLLERSGLLQERSPEVLAFTHLSFQEYLAARRLLAEGTPGSDEIGAASADERHTEVVRFAVAILAAIPGLEANEKTLHLVSKIGERHPSLAAACLMETPSLPIEPGKAESLARQVFDECSGRRHFFHSPRLVSRLMWSLLRHSSNSDQLLLEFLASGHEGHRHPMEHEFPLAILAGRPGGPPSPQLEWLLMRLKKAKDRNNYDVNPGNLARLILTEEGIDSPESNLLELLELVGREGHFGEAIGDRAERILRRFISDERKKMDAQRQIASAVQTSAAVLADSWRAWRIVESMRSLGLHCGPEFAQVLVRCGFSRGGSRPECSQQIRTFLKNPTQREAVVAALKTGLSDRDSEVRLECAKILQETDVSLVPTEQELFREVQIRDSIKLAQNPSDYRQSECERNEAWRSSCSLIRGLLSDQNTKEKASSILVETLWKPESHDRFFAAAMLMEAGLGHTPGVTQVFVNDGLSSERWRPAALRYLKELWSHPITRQATRAAIIEGLRGRTDTVIADLRKKGDDSRIRQELEKENKAVSTACAVALLEMGETKVSAVGQKGPGRVENGPFWMSESSPP